MNARILPTAWPVWAVILLGPAVGSRASAQPPAPENAAPVALQPDHKVAPEAQRVLDRLRAHLGELDRVTCTISMSVTMGTPEDEQKHDESMSFSVERPNRAAIRPIGEPVPQYLLVCDGQTLTQYFGPPLNKFQSDDAPESLPGLLNAISFGMAPEPEMLMSSPHQTVLALMDEERFAALVGGAQAITHKGREDLDGQAHDRLHFSFARIDADVWVCAAGPAWVSRIVPDLTKMLDAMPGQAEELKAQMPRQEILFKDWASPEKLAADTFRFTPPEGAEKVASIAEAMQAQFSQGQDGEDQPSELLGKQAPELALELLGGGKAALEPHRGKEVVVLDFWATWCPPCVRGLPVVAKVTGDFKDKGVMFYAVNEQEPADTIRGFLENKKLSIPVALDKDGKAGERYGVTGIPQTVLIGRDGTVQAVHVGFMPGMEAELTRQIQSLVDGKALAAEGRAAALVDRAGGLAAPAAPAPGEQMAVEEVWSVAGMWMAAATDPATGETYAIRRGGRVLRFDRDGKELASFSIKYPQDDQPAALRLANLAGDRAPELVVFGRWGKVVRAFDTEGKLLWETPVGDGIDDVWTADLDGKEGKGHDEIIVGYNGSTGLHVFESDGRLRWNFKGIGNVWHVTAAPTGEGNTIEVITTSAGGAVHVFDRAGKKVTDLNPRGYANLVRVVPAGPEGPAVIVTSLDNALRLAGMDRAGKQVWKIDIPSSERAHILDGAVATDRPWIAVSTGEGRVFVIDGRTGKSLASTDASGMPSVSWIPGAGDKPPMLVTSSGSRLNASTLREPAAVPGPGQSDKEP